MTNEIETQKLRALWSLYHQSRTIPTPRRLAWSLAILTGLRRLRLASLSSEQRAQVADLLYALRGQEAA